MLSGSVPAPRVTRGFRTGIVIGLAIAILGVAAGTVTGAATPFQRVVVVNAPASPIPVVQQGAVTIENLPSNQDVTVTNFPATQPVSGTVSVSNLPATQPVSGSVSVTNLPAAQLATKSWSTSVAIGNEDRREFDFGRTINVTNLFVENFDDDNISVGIRLANGDAMTVSSDDGNFSQVFPVPTPMTGLSIYCYNIVIDCHVKIMVIGT